MELAEQHAWYGTITTEAVSSVSLKFCVDPHYLEPAVELAFIQNVM